MMAIRNATEMDVRGVSGCLTKAFEAYRRLYTEGAYADTVLTESGVRDRLKNMTILVAEDNGLVAGTIGYSCTGDEGHLRGMAVLPSFQSKGVAVRLLTAAELELRLAGCARVTLDTTRPLVRAMAFYERHGYSPTGAIADFHGMELIEYQKALGDQHRD